MVAGEDFMTPVIFVPLGQGGCHVHLLDDVAPADAGVVGAEGDFALLPVLVVKALSAAGTR
ncbi:MAG: hypothetical protein ABMA15_24720 [Vicinamibacterales bacterium]